MQGFEIARDSRLAQVTPHPHPHRARLGGSGRVVEDLFQLVRPDRAGPRAGDCSGDCRLIPIPTPHRLRVRVRIKPCVEAADVSRRPAVLADVEMGRHRERCGVRNILSHQLSVDFQIVSARLLDHLESIVGAGRIRLRRHGRLPLVVFDASIGIEVNAGQDAVGAVLIDSEAFKSLVGLLCPRVELEYVFGGERPDRFSYFQEPAGFRPDHHTVRRDRRRLVRQLAEYGAQRVRIILAAPGVKHPPLGLQVVLDGGRHHGIKHPGQRLVPDGRGQVRHIGIVLVRLRLIPEKRLAVELLD